MRTEAELQSMANHPTAIGASKREDDPYRAFFAAIEDLKDDVLLHGPQSSEAVVARTRVERLRTEAIDAWKRESQAA